MQYNKIQYYTMQYNAIASVLNDKHYYSIIHSGQIMPMRCKKYACEKGGKGRGTYWLDDPYMASN